MEESKTPQSTENAAEKSYWGGYSPRLLKIFKKRSAAKEGRFFLPHLRPGMNLLDCGCGPGIITVDLAKLVAPGQVVGIDIEDTQFELGRAKALEQNISNIKFETGNVYDLSFPSESFDAVFAHAVLYHLKNPHQALTELYRVLKPGGVIGIRDVERQGDILAPPNPLFDKAYNLLYRAWQTKGGSLFFGHTQRTILHEVGFVDTEASASYDSYGTTESVRDMGERLIKQILHPRNTSIIIEQGWATQAELEEMSNAIKAWSDHPDAFFGIARCEAVGWKK